MLKGYKSERGGLLRATPEGRALCSATHDDTVKRDAAYAATGTSTL